MSETKERGVYIVSADAKDLYLACYSSAASTGYSVRYLSGERVGEINTGRFINTLDNSLDLTKLREVYQKVYRRSDFAFVRKGKEYCRSVINVTFKYNIKEFNRYYGGVYVKFGYAPEEIELEDNICIKNGELCAIRVGCEVKEPVSDDALDGLFCYEDGVYKQKKQPKVLITVAELRNRLYHSGFTADGIKFCRFKRSGGSSRVGKCLFIDEQMYSRMRRWSFCGLNVKEGQEIDLAALEAYTALTLSSTVGTLPLRPENILVIDDFKSRFRDTVAATRLGEDGWLQTAREEVDVENSIWDGQSLIDTEAMGEYSRYGMILLRNRFFKSACFNCDLQGFFRDHGITDISQLAGATRAKSIEDIKLITTPSSIKYMKFGSLDMWLDMLAESPDFGVVKHEKPTHFFGGRMVQAHYQLLNTLQMTQEDVDELVCPSLDYLRQIQTDPAVLRYHIKFTAVNETLSPVSTMNDIVYQMLGVNDKFANTRICQDFRRDIAESFKRTLRRGHILVRGNYSTLLGNPMEMMYASIGRFDGTSLIGQGRICSRRFKNGQIILGSRSPHVTMGNILLAKNRRDEELERYVRLTDEIVCINSINENVLMRLSGADFDSDTALLTDDPILVGAAMKNYERFLVPTSLVDAKKVVRRYTKDEQADLDIKTSVNKIGEIVNLSQELNTRLWDEVNNGASFEDVEDLYYDIAKLDVLSGIEIDKAKREFAVDSVGEIRRLKKKYERRDEKGRQIKPNFFGKIARDKGYYDAERKNYRFHRTTMDYLQHSLNAYRSPRSKEGTVPFAEILVHEEDTDGRVYYPQVNRALALLRDMRRQTAAVWESEEEGMNGKEKSAAAAEIKADYYRQIKEMKFASGTAYRLLLAIEEPENRDIARSLFSLLFALPNDSFLSLIEQSRTPVAVLTETADAAGSVEIYGFRFRKELVLPPEITSQ